MSTSEQGTSKRSEFENEALVHLDGELSERDMRSLRCHLEQCRRCYPMYDWERLFLDVVTVHGSRPEPNEELRRRIARLVGRELHP